MPFAKLMGRFFSNILLQFSLLFLVTSAIFSHIVLNPQNIKDVLSDSDIYSGLVDSVIDQFDKKSADNVEVGIENQNKQDFLPVNDSGVRNAIEQSLPPETIQQQTEVAIDDVFTWLEAPDYADLSFEIDLSMFKTNLIKNLSDYAVQRFEGLPECTNDQLVASNLEADVLSMTCRPPGASTESARQKVEAELGRSEFLQNPVITQDSLNYKDEPLANIERVPEAYQRIKSALFVATALLLIAIVFYIAVRLPLMQALKALGKVLLITGLTHSLFLGVAKFVLSLEFEPSADMSGLDSLGISLTRAIALKIVNFALLFTLTISFVGLGLFMLDHLKKLKSKSPQAASSTPATKIKS